MAKAYHKNPRQITAKQYEALAIDLAELGDLGGIVHDLNSDEIIGGNQRSRVFDINACDVVLTEVLPEPDAQGTVAHGYVLWKGNKYAYRQVRWTERQCERANVVANKRGGTWDFDILANQFEQDDLLAWGFEPFELGAVGDVDPMAEWQGMPEFEQEDLTAWKSLTIHFANADGLNEFAKLVGRKITEQTRSIWYPSNES